MENSCLISMLDMENWHSVSTPLQLLCIVEFQNIIVHFLDSLAAHARMRIRFQYLYELVCFIIFRMRVNIY